MENVNRHEATNVCKSSFNSRFIPFHELIPTGYQQKDAIFLLANDYHAGNNKAESANIVQWKREMLTL